MFLKCVSFDIEVLPLHEQMPRPEVCQILLISYYFNYDYEIENTKTRNIVYILTKNYEAIEIREDKIVYFITDERKFIIEFCNIVKNNDVIVGYNITGFDMCYLIDRARALGMKRIYAGVGDKSLWYRKDLSKGFMVTRITGLSGKIMFDVLGLMKREDESNIFKKQYNLKKLTLEHVSKEILEIHKLEFPVKDMPKYWANTDDVELRNKFIDYCARDSEIPLTLMSRFRLLDKFITLSKASGKVLQEVINSMGTGGFVENLLLKEFRKYDRVLPIRLHPEYLDEEEEEELEGAEVFEPKLGVSENICSVDYKCCAKGTKVLTCNDGWVNIEDLKIGMEVYSFNTNKMLISDRVTTSLFGYAPIRDIVTDFRDMEICDSIKITLEDGHELEGSINHRIKASKNGCGAEYKFIELNKLCIDDCVVISDASYPHMSLKFSKIKEIKKSKAHIYDITTGKTHNYISNGFISHNSLYPSLMIKYNLCYSTIIMENDISKLGLTEADVETQYDEYGLPYARFVRKEKFKGIVPNKLQELLANRAAQKKEMKKYEKGSAEYMLWDATQNATKILLNSHYGYTGDTKSKIYSWFVATAVTTNGRKQIKKTWNMITVEIGTVIVGKREFKLGVVMGDTDSSYMQIIALDGGEVSRDEAITTVMMVLEKVNSTLEKPMQLDFENYVKRIVIVAKKHYAYRGIDDNGRASITSKGIETVRRDWCNYSTKTMSEVINYILEEKDVQVGVNKSVEFAKERARMLKKNQIDINDLVLSKKLTKPITLYDNDAVHVKVAIKMKERGKPSEIGDRIQYIITNNGKKLVGDRAEEADYVIANNIPVDKHYYIHYQLLPPLIGTDTRRGILELLGITKVYMISSLDENQQKLDKWFGKGV